MVDAEGTTWVVGGTGVLNTPFEGAEGYRIELRPLDGSIEGPLQHFLVPFRSVVSHDLLPGLIPRLLVSGWSADRGVELWAWDDTQWPPWNTYPIADAGTNLVGDVDSDEFVHALYTDSDGVVVYVHNRNGTWESQPLEGVDEALAVSAAATPVIALVRTESSPGSSTLVRLGPSLVFEPTGIPLGSARIGRIPGAPQFLQVDGATGEIWLLDGTGPVEGTPIEPGFAPDGGVSDGQYTERGLQFLWFEDDRLVRVSYNEGSLERAIMRQGIELGETPQPPTAVLGDPFAHLWLGQLDLPDPHVEYDRCDADDGL